MINPNAAKPRVLVLGGGFAGLETAFALRSSLTDHADITLVSNRSSFLFRPNTVYIPFGMDEDKLMVDIVKPTRRKGIRFLEAYARDLDPIKRVVSVERDGQTSRELYDYVVIATGVKPKADEVPGLREFAHQMGSAADMVKLRAGLNKALEKAKYGKPQQILLVLPPNVPYTAPLYEMAFMIDTFLRDAHARQPVTITFVTCEASYIEAFGPLLNDLILERFEARAITHHAGVTVTHIEAGAAHFANHDSLPFDLLITFPPTGPAVPFPALPADARGYLDTQLATRHVQGFKDVFAAGDASDFPIKQAFLALLQADAIAEGIAAAIQGRLPRFVFEPVSKFVMEEFDTGLYAQAPFTTDGGLQVAVDSPAYKAGTSPLWRIGKRMLGTVVPWRFSHGEPFNAGLPSMGLDMSVKVLAGMAAGHRREPAPTP